MPPPNEPQPRGGTVGPPPPNPRNLANVLARTISALEERRKREQGEATAETRIADAITRFTGSMPFVYLHLALVGGWVAINLGLVPGVAKFDPTFVILATWASVEAIFLSTFVLISQNRAAEAASARADLDLQISLLAEHEVTRVLGLVKGIAEKLAVEDAADPELPELQRDVAPEAVLDELEEKSGTQRSG
jgi:uncharacterized membrane protein